MRIFHVCLHLISNEVLNHVDRLRLGVISLHQFPSVHLSPSHRSFRTLAVLCEPFQASDVKRIWTFNTKYLLGKSSCMEGDHLWDHPVELRPNPLYVWLSRLGLNVQCISLAADCVFVHMCGQTWEAGKGLIGLVWLGCLCGGQYLLSRLASVWIVGTLYVETIPISNYKQHLTLSIVWQS